jgi:hypothetical protein
MKKIAITIILLFITTFIFCDFFESKQLAMEAAAFTAEINNKKTYLSSKDNKTLYENIESDLKDSELALNEMLVATIVKGSFLSKTSYLVFMYKDEEGIITYWVFK